MRVLDAYYKRREVTRWSCFCWGAGAVFQPIDAEKFHATVQLKQPGIEEIFL
jgi:hypothetical protein